MSEFTMLPPIPQPQLRPSGELTSPPDPPLPTPKRRRKPRSTRSEGGQPGNTNALKHGFYSARAYRLSFTNSDPEASTDDPLPGLDTTSLKGEIKLLRAITARVAALFDDDDLTPDRGLALLNTFSAAAIRVGTLVRTEKVMNGGSDELQKLIQGAISDVLAESENAPASQSFLVVSENPATDAESDSV